MLFGDVCMSELAESGVIEMEENNNNGIFCWFMLPETASVVQWSEFLATDLEVRVRFPALPDFLRSSGSGTGFTQPH
jgi:hypothetical protein